MVRSRSRLQGVAAELDDLRRLHRRVPHDLPVGVCSLAADGAALLWSAMEALSGLAADPVPGERLGELPAACGSVLAEFIDAGHVAAQGIPRGAAQGAGLLFAAQQPAV